MNKCKVVVTGGLGFIGSNFINWLSPNTFDVTVIDDIHTDEYADHSAKLHRMSEMIANRPDVTIIKDRFQMYDIPEGTDYIIHLAAYAGVRRSFERETDYMRNNFTGTELILARMTNMTRKPILINASSSSVYGNSKSDVFTESESGLNPISPYASSKLAAEEIISGYCRANKLRAISLRFFTVYGRGMRPDLAISKFVRAIDHNEKITLYGDGTTVRDYTHVDDICSGIFSAMGYAKTKQSGHEIFNLCSNRAISLKEMVKTIEKTLGKKAKIEYSDMVPGDVDKTLGSYYNAEKAFGYKPLVKFADGIKDYCTWYKGNKGFYDGGSIK